MLSRWGAVATLSLCLYLVPTAVGGTVLEMTLKGSSWLYNFDGEKCNATVASITSAALLRFAQSQS
jgi:hypothetical protein